MNELAGKFGGAMVWLFALLAIGISFGVSKLGITNVWVATAITAGVFFACAWAGGYMTKAGTGLTIAAMVVAIIAYVGILFFMIVGMAKGAVTGAATAGAAAAAGGAAGQAAQAAAASAVKSGMGIFDFIMGAWKPLAGSLAASVVGAIVGAKMKGSKKA
jgi:hypothetical protein